MPLPCAASERWPFDHRTARLGKGSCRIWNGRAREGLVRPNGGSGRTRSERRRDGDRRRGARRWGRVASFVALGLLLVLLVVAVAIVWIQRRPIATHYPEERVRAARRHRQLPPRSRRPAHPGGQQPRHRRSEASRPHRPLRAHPNAAEDGTAASRSIASSRAAFGCAGSWSMAASAGARSTS